MTNLRGPAIAALVSLSACSVQERNFAGAGGSGGGDGAGTTEHSSASAGTSSTRTARTNLSGSLDPTGQSTLCCVE
ncbi:hypothetical protein WMF27_03310 [Sorangium sp. So ce281]|uniref:hypothetical protein n=1 Tax=Sorangium sp. So ce281 TaxID=3133293 RepID=UPI003F62D96B